MDMCTCSTRNQTSELSNNRGFTLIEIIVVIVVLGILAVTVMPTYQDMQMDSKVSACKGALGSLRSGISVWTSNQIVVTGTEQFPPIDTLRLIGAVMEHEIPRNPFQSEDRAPDSIVQGTVRGVTVGERGGWAYNPATGDIWPNTNTSIPGDGCSDGNEVGENQW